MTTDVEWAHPSVRDLVIDHLMMHDADRLAFLARAELNGIMLALSTKGGAEGERLFPLLRTDADWAAVAERAADLAATGDIRSRRGLLSALHAAVTATTPPPGEFVENVRNLIRVVLDALRTRWDAASEAITIAELNLFYTTSLVTEPLESSPNLVATWDYFTQGAREVTSVDDARVAPTLPLESWLQLCALLARNEPRWLRKHDVPDAFVDELSTYVGRLRSAVLDIDPLEDLDAIGEPPDEPTYEEYEELGWLDDIVRILEHLREVVPAIEKDVLDIKSLVGSRTASRRRKQTRREDWEQERADEYQEWLEEPDEPDEQPDRVRIDDIFIDLVTPR
jgi:hypothetical protein